MTNVHQFLHFSWPERIFVHISVISGILRNRENPLFSWQMNRVHVKAIWQIFRQQIKEPG